MPILLDALVVGCRYDRLELHQLNQLLGGDPIPMGYGVFLNPQPAALDVNWRLMLATHGNGHGYVSDLDARGRTFAMTGNGEARAANEWLSGAAIVPGRRVGLAYRIGNGPHEYRGEVSYAGCNPVTPVFFNWAIPPAEPTIDARRQILANGTREQRIGLRPVAYLQLPATVRALIDAKLDIT